MKEGVQLTDPGQCQCADAATYITVLTTTGNHSPVPSGTATSAATSLAATGWAVTRLTAAAAALLPA